MRRLLSGITVLTLFAGCVASIGAEARDWRGYGYRSGNFHGAVYRSGGSRADTPELGAGAAIEASAFTGVRLIRGYYQDYGWRDGNGGWWGPVAAASAILPLAAAATQVDYADVSLGGYCATPEKTCELYSAAQVGTGCSCRVPGGHARGVVE